MGTSTSDGQHRAYVLETKLERRFVDVVREGIQIADVLEEVVEDRERFAVGTP